MSKYPSNVKMVTTQHPCGDVSFAVMDGDRFDRAHIVDEPVAGLSGVANMTATMREYGEEVSALSVCPRMLLAQRDPLKFMREIEEKILKIGERFICEQAAVSRYVFVSQDVTPRSRYNSFSDQLEFGWHALLANPAYDKYSKVSR